MRELAPFDPAEGLGAKEAAEAFFGEALATNDVGYIAHARAVLARAGHMFECVNEDLLANKPD